MSVAIMQNVWVNTPTSLRMSAYAIELCFHETQPKPAVIVIGFAER